MGLMPSAAASVANADWDAGAIEQALAPLFEDGRTLRADPEARKAHWTRIEERAPLHFDVVQTLIDAEGEGDAQIEAEVVLESTRLPAGPMLRVVGAVR